MAAPERYDLRRRAFESHLATSDSRELIGHVRLQGEVRAVAIETITTNGYVHRAKVSNIEDLDQALAAVHGGSFALHAARRPAGLSCVPHLSLDEPGIPDRREASVVASDHVQPSWRVLLRILGAAEELSPAAR
jgi:hypothetical protein